MNKGWLVVLALFVIIIIGLVMLFAILTPTVNAPAPTNDTSGTIVADAPKSGAAIASPLTITGKARGTFYFEATFPVILLDANGKVLVQGPAQAQSNWMTTDFVPFVAKLIFAPQPAGSKGTLVLTNDNPSGDPTKQKTLEIPVTF